MSNIGMKRWAAVVYYRTGHGLVDVHHDIDELDELQNLVEAGPHFGAIQRIEVRYQFGGTEMLTVEEAAQL